MAESRGAAVLPPCWLGGAAGDAPAPGRQCCGGCGLARLVRRLRQRGRRALRASASQPRRRACQYDPLSYARNFDLGGWDGDTDADDAARVHYSCSFSSRFVLVPAASQSVVAGAGGAPAAVATAS